MSAYHKLVKEAVSSLIFTHPFYASVLLQLEIVEDYSCDTFWTDGKQLGFNPDYVDTLTFSKTKGVLAHEVCHVILLHFARIKGRDIETWNKATDYVINWALVQSGFELPEGALLDQRFSNCNAEDAYRVLIQEKQQKQEQEESQQDEDSDSQSSNGESDQEDEESDSDESQDGNGDSESDKDGDNSNDNNSDSSQDNSGEGSESESEASGNGTPDSDNIGQDSKPKTFQGNFGEIRQPKEDSNQVEERAVMMAKFAENIAKMCGSLPAGMQRLIEDARKPKHDWKEVLNRFLTEQAAKDYSFLTANRRHLGRGIILPTLKNKTIGKIVVAIDTSGSVSDSEVKQMLSEITGMLDFINENSEQAEITIIYCDSDVAGVDVYDGTTNFNPKGGGGTRFSPVFRYIQDNEIEPNCVIYITDGYCSDFGVIVPDYPVLWAITVSYGDFIPPFGEVMKLHNFLG